jgi:hypothetical protein
MDNFPGNDLSAETMTGAPPPPQEVKVRTMASDLASMTASGGGLPQFQNVKIAGGAKTAAVGTTHGSTVNPVIAIVVILVVLALIAVGCFVLVASQKKNTSQPSAVGGQ